VQIQSAVKKETFYIAASAAAGTCVMFLLFFVLHRLVPGTVPFDYKVVLGGILGSVVAVGNFFFMGLTVQKVASADNQDEAYNSMKVSYRYRTLSQLLWVVLAMVLPVINCAAGIIPLFFPSLCIKARSILGMIKAN
jgi:hypothetical protein